MMFKRKKFSKRKAKIKLLMAKTLKEERTVLKILSN